MTLSNLVRFTVKLLSSYKTKTYGWGEGFILGKVKYPSRISLWSQRVQVPKWQKKEVICMEEDLFRESECPRCGEMMCSENNYWYECLECGWTEVIIE